MVINNSVSISFPEYSPLPLVTRSEPFLTRIYHAYFKSREYILDKEDYRLFIPWLNCYVFVPKGFIFDLASIPRPLWPLMPPVGIFLIPSIFHDFFYRYGICIFEYNKQVIICSVTKWEADKMFSNISDMVNEMPVSSAIARFFLTIAGYGWITNRINNKDFFVDFPDYQKFKRTVNGKIPTYKLILSNYQVFGNVMG